MPSVVDTSREQLLFMLAEAAEVEHNFMCTYLYAAFSLKSDDDEGLSHEQLLAVKKWRKEIIAVAVEEMSHLALVANLTTAVGGVPHFERSEFPIEPGFMPANITARLAPFNMDTLCHFIFLERPDDSDFEDSPHFLIARDYDRGPIEQTKLMPVALDYETIGTLYSEIEKLVAALDNRYGSEALFVGDPSAQVGPKLTPLPGLITISNLQEAKLALRTIVDQGEGAAADCGHGHYARFLVIKQEYEQFLAHDPDFEPARAVAENPVMRQPPTPEGKVWVCNPQAATVMDFVNALYIHMQRLLMQAFGRSGNGPEKRILINAATDLMQALTPAAEYLTRLPANDQNNCNAGMSFATTRSSSSLPLGSDLRVLNHRFKELVIAADSLSSSDARMERAAKTLDYIASAFAQEIDEIRLVGEGMADADIDIARGEFVDLVFDTKKCIHSRFCVLGAPQTFQANSEGEWLFPDKADPDKLVAIAEQCPSGAITVVRKDGGRAETRPEVNVLRIRENGPLAIHADLRISGDADGYRRTLCRCGLSKSKPYCDNSHSQGFTASGEREAGNLEDLPQQNGSLKIEPLLNGPLQISGSLEICTGTGTAFERTQTTRLCRCGASQNKPFCDNSHIETGFKSD